MHRDASLGDAGGKLGPSKGSLDAVDGHGGCCRGAFVVASSQGGKDEDRVFMGEPIAPKQGKGLLGKWHVAIFCALAPMDMDHHPLAVNIGDLKAQGF